jgi:hypothetical protein
VTGLTAGSTAFFLENRGEGVLAPQALRVQAQPPSPDRALQEEWVWEQLQMGWEALEEAIPGQGMKESVGCL